MADLTVIILAHNEELHIERAIRAVLNTALASKVYVVDSGSTDKTVALATEAGAEVVHHPFVNYAKQFQWALDELQISTEWTMRLDADEIIPPTLVKQITDAISEAPIELKGLYLKRRHIFLGRWIRHGGRYPLILLRIWRSGVAKIEDRWMDEHMVLASGRTLILTEPFDDENLNDLSFFTEKHNRYATREAVDVLLRKYDVENRNESLRSSGSGLQASLKRTIKERVYNVLPFPITTAAYFIWRFIFQLGFLDGRPGLIYHFLQGFWYRFLVGSKVQELDRVLERLPNIRERKEALRKLTGLDVI
jgi:glycosyltransferase involved in cell wall biosynthesis